ncbi:MAG: pyrrolo-quinoline quinone [Alphaproteobacteria bacterium]|nr:pyrrolo-quinoline quinone [Alphaproteobacteria bacterium]
MRWAAALAAAGLLVGCEGSLPPKIQGTRVSVMSLERTLEPDPGMRELRVRLPRPHRNPDWPQAGGYPNHALHHLEAEGPLALLWRADAGAGSSSERRLLSGPVVAEGRLFTLDAEAMVTAFDAGNGARLWRRSLVPAGERADAGYGGGLAVEDGRLYVATGFGDVWAMDAGNGAVHYRRSIGIPFRAAPTVSGDRLFVISYDNQLHALAAADGRTLWTHNGIAEDAGLLASSAAAADAGIVVAPYSSGELVAIRVENGRVAWADSLVARGRFSPVETLAAIAGRPVIDRGRVYAVSHGGQLVAIDLRSGSQVWDQPIAAIRTPWVAGDYLYLVTLDSEVVCLSRQDGRVRWVQPLVRWVDDRRKVDRVIWTGPLLASDRLIVASSQGVALSISPYTGEVLGQIQLPDGVSIPPIVADGMMYVLTDDARVFAYK